MEKSRRTERQGGIQLAHRTGRSLCSAATLEDFSAANHTQQDDHDRDYQKNMNEATHGERRHHAKQPENDEDDGNCVKHVELPVFLLIQNVFHDTQRIRHSLLPHRLLLLTDLIADHAANDCAADRTGCAATGQYRACNAANGGADGGVAVTRGHTGAARYDHQCQCNGGGGQGIFR
jgi:hypothetical protein